MMRRDPSQRDPQSRSLLAAALLALARASRRTGRLRQHRRHRQGSVRRRAARRHGHDHQRRAQDRRHRRHQRVRLLREGSPAAGHLRGQGRARRLQDRGRARRRGQRRHADAGRLQARRSGSSASRSTVTGGSPLLKTDRADVSTTFDSKQITDLPVLDRNFTKFILLTPGTQQLQWQHAASENPQGSTQTMVNGQHFSGTGYQLDGTENRDPILGIIVINPTLESIGETKITSQNYDAEFGQATAGVVSVQTKSGQQPAARQRVRVLPERRVPGAESVHAVPARSADRAVPARDAARTSSAARSAARSREPVVLLRRLPGHAQHAAAARGC